MLVIKKERNTGRLIIDWSCPDAISCAQCTNSLVMVSRLLGGEYYTCPPELRTPTVGHCRIPSPVHLATIRGHVSTQLVICTHGGPGRDHMG